MTQASTSDIHVLERIGDRVILSVSWSTYSSHFQKKRYLDSPEYLADEGEYFANAEDLVADLRKHRKTQ